MNHTGQLIKGIDLVSTKGKILVCFPFAGGGASAFYRWVKGLNTIINICPIQLPGREERILEEPYKDVETVVDDIVQALMPRKSCEFYFFGHSMGAKIAYEAAKRLERGGNEIKMLMVSGSRAPHIPEPNPIYYLPDLEFISAVRKFEGIPEEILNNKELLNFFLPVLRADFQMNERYCTKDRKKLKCPIVAFGGDSDQEADESEMIAWEEYTNNRFCYEMFHGGHFFIKQQEKEVLYAVRKSIEKPKP